jgi:multidrug transporter EmrE-like cation transporter
MIILSIASFIVLVFLYVKLFSLQEVGSSHAIAKIMAIIMVFIYGSFFFEEKMTRKKIFGVILGIISIVLLI